MYRTKTHTHTPHRPLLLCQAFVVRMLGWREHAIREKHATQYQGRRIVVSVAVDEAAAAAAARRVGHWAGGDARCPPGRGWRASVACAPLYCCRGVVAAGPRGWDRHGYILLTGTYISKVPGCCHGVCWQAGKVQVQQCDTTTQLINLLHNQQLATRKTLKKKLATKCGTTTATGEFSRQELRMMKRGVLRRAIFLPAACDATRKLTIHGSSLL